MVRFDKVTVEYNGQPIIRNISFHIHENEKMALYGKSGSGKSTVLTTIVGAHIPSSGSIYYKGELVNKRNIDWVRKSVSFIGQEPILGAEKIRDALLLPFSYKMNRGKSVTEDRINETLEMLRLNRNILDKEASVVSGGEKQRIAIARALLQDKKVFLADEITSALDTQSKKAVIELFQKDQYTLISVSHDSHWFDICSKFLEIEDGEIIGISKSPKTP